LGVEDHPLIGSWKILYGLGQTLAVLSAFHPSLGRSVIEVLHRLGGITQWNPPTATAMSSRYLGIQKVALLVEFGSLGGVISGHINHGVTEGINNI